MIYVAIFIIYVYKRAGMCVNYNKYLNKRPYAYIMNLNKLNFKRDVASSSGSSK